MHFLRDSTLQVEVLRIIHHHHHHYILWLMAQCREDVRFFFFFVGINAASISSTSSYLDGGVTLHSHGV